MTAVDGAPDARDAPRPAMSSARAVFVATGAAVSTALCLVGGAIGLFFNPVWVGFEQRRTDVDLWTGWSWETVRSVTDSVVAEVYLGPGSFSQTVGGAAVFTPGEAGHMVDVRRVVLSFAAVVAIAAVVLVLARRSDDTGTVFWRGVRAGASFIAGGVVIVGLAVTFFFDAAFEMFHRLFFPAGSYTFDPRTDRLVQLFPERLWVESATVFVVVLFVGAVAVALLARRRIGAPPGSAGHGVAGHGVAADGSER